ncbi:MAG TPA: M55 family metallopeptidase [Armatimonadota bacterium]|jgi:D-amino peptidase
MKIYIFADMEGISGISNSDFVTTGSALYPTGRRYYTADINACVRGCFDAGAQSVLVRDGHGSGCNVLWDELDSRVELVQGAGQQRRLPGLEECDALILLGYHAMAGTAGALLEHSYSSATVQNIWLNGRLVGEIGIDAHIAGEQGVPVVMVSGDDKACAEASAWLPNAITCTVKTGLSCQCARLLPMGQAHRLLEEKTAEALANLTTIPPLAIAPPVTLRIEMKERIPIPHEHARPGIRVIDGRTYEATADTVEAALARIF